MSGQISETPILITLSERLQRSVGERDLHRARLHLLDWIGCATAGAKEPAGQILRSQPVEQASGLAFIWGGLGNILEMDDVDKRALLHPGPCILPAALAMASVGSASGEDLLTAIVRGYEATIRLGRAVGSAHYAMWHSTGTCGAIGAAAASASLLKLDETQAAQAMALAVSQSAGLWHTRYDPASMGKQLHTAVAARAGFEAAELARAGFTGPLSILEGEQGFFAAMCKGADASDVMADFGGEWLIHEVSFKPWPACRHAHAVIDAALELREKIDVPQAGPITVRTYGDALKFCDKPDPKSVIEAKFSLQHAMAVCLVRGAPGMEDFSVEATQNEALSALRQRVRVEVGEDYETAYPARFGAEVSCGVQTVKAPDALGDPENPVSEAQLKDKARMLMREGEMSAQEIEETIAHIEQIENQASCAQLLTPLQEALS
ncbi:MAG: MmgE/PrpD family protein [Henriciella sp.]|nr:MmgE/PrpD family protein [Henriciella sp.]